MTKRNTREIILEEALNLFSVKGYQSVTVKEIAQAVGIKDSSLYKHFDSKQAIYDTLLEWMNRDLLPVAPGRDGKCRPGIWPS